MSVFQLVVLGTAPPNSQQDGPVWVDTTPDPLSWLTRNSTRRNELLNSRLVF